MTIGEMDTIEAPSQTGRRWAYRAMIGVGVLLLFGVSRTLCRKLQDGAVWLHNWAGPHADRLTGSHTPTKAIVGKLVPHEPYFADPAALWIVVGFALLLIGVGAYLLGQSAPVGLGKVNPFTVFAKNAGKVAGITVGVLVVLVLVGWLATKWEPARPVVGIVLRTVASLASAAVQGIGVAAP